MNQELETRIQERTKALTDSLAELEKTQNSLVESKKLAALGQLIIGISHEMNTPIGTAITGVTYLNLLVKDIQQCLADATCTTDVAQETFQDVDALSHSIIKSLEHAAALIDKFKSLSVAPFEDRLGEADLYTIAQQAIKPFLKDLDRQNHQIDVRIPSPFVIETHAVTMGNILTQLISNALFHGFEDQLNGLIQILVEEEAHALIIKVIDNGKGLKQDELDKIFDPFFTTHRGTGKTGLGMNIVYNQVHQILHGDIVVENNAGSRGCTIVLRLPKEHAE